MGDHPEHQPGANIHDKNRSLLEIKPSIQPLIRIKLLNHGKFIFFEPLLKEISTTIFRHSHHSQIIEILSPQMMRSFRHQLSRDSLHSP